MKGWRLWLLPGLALLAACGGGATPEVDTVATRVAEELAVAQTLTASAPTEAPEPTVTTAASPTAPEATATEAAVLCTVVSARLNLRPGPGTVYDPPLGNVPEGTQLRARARNPEGTWLEVAVEGSGETGWVSAAPQFLSCEGEVEALALGDIPPTPVPTPPLLVVQPIEGGGNWVSEILLSDYFPAATTSLVFRVRAFDGDVGTNDGDGIDFVIFRIYRVDDHGDELVYEKKESTPAYCAFGGNEADCPAWVFADHGFTWPDGVPITEGTHRLEVEVQGKPKPDGEVLVRRGELTFVIDLP